MIDTMKTNIAYLFAGLLAVTLFSCSDDSDLLIHQEPLVVLQELVMQEEEMKSDSEEVSTPMLDLQTVADAQRALRPSISQQMDGEQPDKKGQKGRDHRDWFDTFDSMRLKDLEKNAILQFGDLYAIERSGKDSLLFKFYLPEELKDKAYLYEGLHVKVITYFRYGDGLTISKKKELFSNDCFSFDDSFMVSKNEWEQKNRDHIIQYFFWDDIKCDGRETTLENLVIFKEWHE